MSKELLEPGEIGVFVKPPGTDDAIANLMLSGPKAAAAVSRVSVGDECEVTCRCNGHYHVKLPTHDNVIVRWDKLRRHRPPKEELGSWDDIEKSIGWNPTKERVI